MARRHWSVALMAAVVGTVFAADPAEKAPFTLSKETTAITSPVRANGAPDYIAALNAKYGANVTPKNNAFAAFVSATGTEDGAFAARVHDETLRLLGILATPAGTQNWQGFEQFLKEKNGVDPTDVQSDPYYDARRAPWKAEKFPIADEYLKKMGPLMDKVTAASKLPQWWVPAVAAPPPDDSMISVLLPSLGRVRDVCNALSARATLRAGSGDIDGFMSDVMTIKRLGHLQTHGFTVIEMLVGIAINSLGDDAIGAVAGAGLMNAEQCATLRKQIAGLEEFPLMTDVVDQMERWDMLDAAERIAMKDDSAIKLFTDLDGSGKESDVFQALQRDQVDWDAVLRRMNMEMDKIVAAMKIEPLDAMNARVDEFERMVSSWKKYGPADGGTTEELAAAMRKQPGESKDAYSQRVAEAIMRILLPSLGKAEELRRRTMLVDAMTMFVLTAAEVKANSGSWPELKTAVAATGPLALPKDMYNFDSPVYYLKMPAGIRVYSVGRNQRDDGGIRGGGDDIAIGVDNPTAKTEALP